MSQRRQPPSDTDTLEEFPVPFDRANDTTAEELVDYGRDIQAIPWDRLEWTREDYRCNWTNDLHPNCRVGQFDQCRTNRLHTFRNYTNVLKDGEEYNRYLESLESQCHPVQKSGKFFDFVVNLRKIQSSIVHFQLRNLLWATSKHDIFLMRDKCINHWNLMSHTNKEVLNLRGHLDGGPSPGGSRLGEVNISTMCAKGNLLAVGGFNGQLILQRISDPCIAHEGYITQDENGITNALEIYDEESSPCVLTSNNDNWVRVFDAQTYSVKISHEFDWAVNYSTVCPMDKKIVAVAGDDPNAHVLDLSSNRKIVELEGHRDFSFAAAWLPTERVLATGNQDLTTRLWDLRKPDAAFAVLRGNMGAIRSIRYSPDGQYLAMAEPADFVQVFDVSSGYTCCQEIDVFGEISGISFSPDALNLFVGVVDETYGSLVKFRRQRNKSDYW